MFVLPLGSTESLDRYKIKRSLRFKSNQSCYLSKTLTVNTAVGGNVSTTYNLAISVDTNNYVLYDAAKAAGWNGYSLCTVNLTINSGVKVGSVRSTLPALDIRGFPSGIVINVTVNSNAYVVGAGGAGGAGGVTSNSQNIQAGAGGPGGDAIWTNSYVTITNYGTIAGGGGGGGGGGGDYNGSSYPVGHGGGGGAGLIAGQGGGSGYDQGQNGTLTTGGLGYPSDTSFPYANGGGNGGNLGMPGTKGSQRYADAGFPQGGGTQFNYLAGAGGAAGNYVVGNNFVTWHGSGAFLGGSVATTVSKNWTVSFWVKRGKLSNGSQAGGGLLQAGADPSAYYAGENIYFDADDKLSWVCVVGGNPNSYYFWIRTTAQFRDPSAWYHIVLVSDIVNSDPNERLRVYVNGDRQAIEPVYFLAQAGTVSRWFNTAYPQYIGKGYGNCFDGVMAEFNAVDGRSLAPTEFGKRDYKTGAWVPKKYVGTYGTYGYYLPFTDNRALTDGYIGYNPNYIGVGLPDSVGFDQRYNTTRFVDAGTASFTIPPFKTNITIEAWGAGGGGGPSRVGSVGTAGQVTTVTIGNIVMSAGGGGGGSTNSGGSGGTATGATINVNGNDGVYSVGGDGPQGGGPGGYTILNGSQAHFPGGGGGGGYDSLGNGYGGGSGAYVRQTFTTSDLTPGQTISLYIGAGGYQGEATPNQGVYGGGPGANGMVQITVDGDIPRNWFTNGGFSLRPGTAYTHEYDSLIDSPTQYKNVGNYATFSPVENQSSVTYYNPTLLYANMQATAHASYQVYAYATMVATPGKWYFEGRIASLGDTTATYISPNNSFTRYQADGKIYNGATIVATVASYGASDVIGVAFDNVNMTVDWYLNGLKQATTTIPQTSSPWKPMVSMQSASGSWYINFGQQPFAYTQPPGYKTLCTANLANAAIYKGRKYFDIATRVGTGSGQLIQGISFQPDFVWSKIRNTSGSHVLVDAVRGANKTLSTDTPNQEATGGTITSFTQDGYGVDASQNVLNNTYVDWLWRAGNSVVTNNAGSNGATISSTYSVNNLSKFSIVNWSGNNIASSTIAHGLGVKPDFMIIKNRTSGSTGWPVYHSSQGAVSVPYLNDPTAFFNKVGIFNNTEPNSSVFAVGGNSVDGYLLTNAQANNYVAYCWAEVPGFSKFGKFDGNTSSDGVFVYCGFRPRWILIKSIKATNYWAIVDSARNFYNVANAELDTNGPYAELAGAGDSSTNIDFLSNGFKLRGTVSNNYEGLIYAAFAETPFKYANARGNSPHYTTSLTVYNYNLVISADRTDFNLRSAALAAGWDGVIPLNATVTVNSGVYVGSSNVANAAFTVGALPAGSAVTITNNGYITGIGGAGGSSYSGWYGYDGGPGGNALDIGYATTIYNYGTIAGGGGGGAGGGGFQRVVNDYTISGGAGGGGQGYQGGSAGYYYPLYTLSNGSFSQVYGNPGTKTAPGLGISGEYPPNGTYSISGNGGNGGTLGQPGGNGAAATGVGVQPGGNGGAAGKCAVGNSYINWQVNGTRLGSLV